MAGRGNGQWPGWPPSTGAQYADPMMDHEGRLSYLEAIQQSVQSDIVEIREDQHEHLSLLQELREAFARHTSRSLAQIVRQRWDEIAGYLIVAAAVSYANRGWLTEIGLRLAGIHPDQ